MKKKRLSQCYVCGREATTQEHVPPRCFFPRGAGQQLLTVPSCPEHNNAKSHDDQYVLAHICMNASWGDNLAKQIFRRSVEPQLERKPAFKAALSMDARTLPDGSRAYSVDTARLDHFFDHLVNAVYLDRYKIRLDRDARAIKHVYLSLATDDQAEIEARRMLLMSLGHLSASFTAFVKKYEAAKLTEPVYEYRLFDPLETAASVTFHHFFYGVFEVVSLLTRTSDA